MSHVSDHPSFLLCYIYHLNLRLFDIWKQEKLINRTSNQLFLNIFLNILCDFICSLYVV